MTSFNYLKDHILYQIFKTILSISSKKHETVTDNPSITTYVDKIIIIFKIKAGYYLQRLMSEKKKLLGSDKSKINKDQSGENMPYLEATKVVLMYCYIDNDEYQQDSGVLYTFGLDKPFS